MGCKKCAEKDKIIEMLSLKPGYGAVHFKKWNKNIKIWETCGSNVSADYGVTTLKKVTCKRCLVTYDENMRMKFEAERFKRKLLSKFGNFSEAAKILTSLQNELLKEKKQKENKRG